jgi:NTE family protein
MSRVGLVLGGGGITGASFHFGALFALEMATGWNPTDADVIVGTSSGAVVAALTRAGHLDVEALVGNVSSDEEFAAALAERIFRRTRVRGVGRWIRHGLIPGMRRPGVRFALGAPAPYSTEGISEWVHRALGPAAFGWPSRPTTIVAYEIESRRRVAFGTEGSPDTDIATAVAASAAVPMMFDPVEINGRRYVDGGIASGTNADLVLGMTEPLDLVIVIAPMAAADRRDDARFYEGLFDRYGGVTLTAELDAIHTAWPDTDIVVIRPDRAVLAETRPNPLSAASALPAFLQTLRSMRGILGSVDVWPVLERHVVRTRRRLPFGRRARTT